MISREEVDNLAQLARLKVGEEEAAGLQKDISNILEYVAQISGNEAPASLQDDGGRSPGTSLPPNTPHNIMREDVPRPASDPLVGKREQIIAAFPRRELARPDDSGRSGGNEYLVVRKIIDKGE